MRLNPYLLFKGNCEEALQFYRDVLGGSIKQKMTFAGTPAERHVPAEWRNKVMHMHLRVGDQDLMGSDAPPEMYEKPQGASVALQYTDIAEAERVFNRLAEGGTVRMPFQKTFWAERYGHVVDRFGISWMVNCDLAGAAA